VTETGTLTPQERDALTPGGWRISGQKTYISAVDDSDVMLVVAKDTESGGFSVLALPLPCDRLQLQPVRVIAPAPERQWSVFFDDVELPADAVIGQPGGGARALFDVNQDGVSGRRERHRPAR
jgi:acyl-CoA dehydrogenase